MTKIYLIRHAEAEGNIYRFAHGQYNGYVTVKGKTQISLLEERFKDVQIDAVYSSDLARAVTTAQAVAGPRRINIETSKELREVNMGIWEDCPWGEIERTDPGMNRLFNSDPAKWHVEGSERFEDVSDRMHGYIESIAKQNDGRTIAVFSHGFAIRTFICRIKNVPSGDTASVPYCDNTAVTLLTYESGEFDISYAGDNSHISGKSSTLEHQSWWRAPDRHKPENLHYIPLHIAASRSQLQVFKANAGKKAQADTEFAAFLVDEPVGIVGLDTKKEAGKGRGFIGYLYVMPVHRNNNFGTQLVGLAISEFRKSRREKLCIGLPANCYGINLMNKCGFDTVSSFDGLCLMEKDIRNW